MPNPAVLIINHALDFALIVTSALFLPCFALAVTLALIYIARNENKE